MAEDKRTEVRDVRVDDPELTPEANRALTGELRDALGADRVRVPRDQGTRRDVEGGDPLAAFLAGNRVLIGITLAAAIVVGAVCAVITGSWWLLAVAVLVHAAATLAVAFFAIRATGEVEKPAPETVARLEAEGVPDPERAFNERVREYASAEPVQGNVRTTTPEEDPAQATEEQQDAVTPASEPSAPAPPEDGR
jgi:hypothetical protein